MEDKHYTEICERIDEISGEVIVCKVTLGRINADMGELKSDIKDILKEIKDINQFRYTLTGKITVVGVIVSSIVSVVIGLIIKG